MDDQTDQIRKPRADAVRNRERVLEAAKVVFNAGGPEASLEAVAKRAGVGIGTGLSAEYLGSLGHFTSSCPPCKRRHPPYISSQAEDTLHICARRDSRHRTQRVRRAAIN